jgi:hypothetical protein
MQTEFTLLALALFCSQAPTYLNLYPHKNLEGKLFGAFSLTACSKTNLVRYTIGGPALPYTFIKLLVRSTLMNP